MKTKISKLYIFILSALLAGLCFSCYDEGEEAIEDGQTVIHGSIGTRAANNDEYVDPEGNVEIINTWWIVFVNANNVIANIAERSSLNTSAISNDDFTLTLDNGTYTVYSFANISKSDVEECAGKSITKGSAMPDLSEVKFPISTVIPNGTLVDGMSVAVPMTGKETYTAKGGSIDKDFEVIRMVAKVKFEFRNRCANTAVTVKDLSFGPTNTGDVLLMPDYETLLTGESLNVKDPVVPAGTDTVTLKFDFKSTDPTGTVNYPVLPKNSHATDSYTNFFYLRESVAATNPTGHFSIKMHVVRDDKPVELVYAVTDKEFTGINRNDYLLIPIAFTDYKVDVKVNFYPPIGGYPAEITTKNEQEYYCTFATGGDFELVPYVYDASNSTPLDPSKFTYTITEISDPDGLFTPTNPSMVGKKPTVDSVTGEIVGALSPEKQGTVSIKIEVNVKTGPSTSQVYYRTIYVIRKNKT